LRSETSLIQTAGRAARHLHGEVILYADIKTQSIQRFLAVADYRRQKQLAYNQEHKITPRSVVRAVEESLSSYRQTTEKARAFLNETGGDIDLSETISELEQEMVVAANNLEFENLGANPSKPLFRGFSSQPATLYMAFSLPAERKTFPNRAISLYHALRSFQYGELATPLHLPAGTELLATGHFDNSALNPNNPDPDQWVGYGDRTVDEMAHAWMNVVYFNDEEFKALAAERKAKVAKSTNND